VVTKDIPANAIAVGIPARVIRMRQAEERDTMQTRVASSNANAN
jgi:acetyltransferase-like isoleucine patch superfamily enzyme